MPSVYIIGGPNGAGKTTLAQTLLPEYLRVADFVNADQIAGGLSAYDPESVAIEAGRAMLRRIHELADGGRDFAFETTLASRFFIGFLGQLRKRGYLVTLIYVWLESVNLAMRRVQYRVQLGGHDVPRNVVARRYERGLKLLRTEYVPLADAWYIFDNSGTMPVLVAEQQEGSDKVVYAEAVWKKLWEQS
jgi:predicted ABC-type ATPase